MRRMEQILQVLQILHRMTPLDIIINVVDNDRNFFIPDLPPRTNSIDAKRSGESVSDLPAGITTPRQKMGSGRDVGAALAG